MPPKTKKKEEKIPVQVIEETKKLAPIDVNFIINSIENIRGYARVSSKFCLDLLHSGKPITSSSRNGGTFHLKPSAEAGDFLSSKDIVNVNLHYKLTVHPDNDQDVALLADCPLLVVLSVFTDAEGNEIRPEDSESSSLLSSEEGEVAAPGVVKTPIGYGSLDLIHIITKNSLDKFYEIYVYPETTYPNIKTPKVNLHMYSVIGILQCTKLRFCNILTLTLENIFNPPEGFSDPDSPVRVDFSFVGADLRRPLFSFSQGKFQTFRSGEIHKRWSGLPMVKGLRTMTTYPSSSALTDIYVEDTDLFSSVDIETEVCMFNAIHRTLLTEANAFNLEQFILQKPEHICVTISVGDEESPRYYGNVDLSPLVYPDVRQGRFTVEFKAFHVSQKSAPGTQPLTSKGHQHNVKTKEKDILLPGDNIPLTVKSRVGTTPRLSKIHGLKKKHRDSLATITDPINDGEGPFFAVFAVDFLKPLTERATEEECDCEKLLAVKCKVDKLPSISQEKLQNITRTELADEIITIIRDLPNCSEHFLVKTEDGMKVKCEQFQQTDCYKDMRDNLMEKITKYTAANYHFKMPTNETNYEFKNLMTNVYNDLVYRVEEVVNDYYAGSRNFVDLAKIMALQNIRMSTAYECHYAGFHYISEAIWDDVEAETQDDENIFIDLVVKEIMIKKPENAVKQLARVFDLNPNNYYGFLIELYLTYMDDPSEVEVWLKLLLKLTKKHSDQVECWALLYFFYLSCNYRPGYIHAKMMCEKNYPHKIYPHFWERIHNFYDVVDHDNPFCCSIYIFLKLGLYGFANLLFEKMKDYFYEYNRNRIQCYILQEMNKVKELQDFLKVISATSSVENRYIAAIYQANLKYESGKQAEAIIDYEVIYHDPDNEDLFFLSAYLRCGFWALNQGDYADARGYFWTCCKNQKLSFLAWYGLGISSYRLKQYAEAELALSKASNIFAKIAELWIYFTMVNLAMKHYPTAKECCYISRRFTFHEPELEEEMENLFQEHNIHVPPKF